MQVTTLQQHHRASNVFPLPWNSNNKSDKNLTLEVGQQALKAPRISGCLNETVWSNKLLRIDPNVRIYKSVVRPILTYAAETRSDTAKTRQILETTEMKTLRRIMNKTRLDKIRNRKIQGKYEIQNIGDWVQRRRIEWNALISRMNEDRIVRRVRENVPIWKKKPRLCKME